MTVIRQIYLAHIQINIKRPSVENSQVATTINNSGLGVRDVEYIANTVVDEKTKNKPDIFMGTELPDELPDGSIFFKYDDNNS